MDHWIMMAVIWAVVEFVQFLRKRPYLARMKTGAWWAVIAGGLESIGAMSPSMQAVSTLSTDAMFFLLNGVVVVVVYWLRVLLTKGWSRLRT